MNLWQKLSMALGGWVYVGKETRPGWKGSLPFYATRCRYHGVVKNYPQGFDGDLECPKCQRERVQRMMGQGDRL
jgi:hypothetical protein